MFCNRSIGSMWLTTSLLFLSGLGLILSDSSLEDPNLFEGDIILDPDQKEAIEKGSLAYGATAGKIWPTTIPYEFSPNLRDEVKQGIYKAFEHYKKHTCIRFKKRSTRERQYMYFVGSKYPTAGGCSSHIGPNGGARKVNLGGGGCHKWNVIVHEVLHALGFWHEQSRPDRDQYIDIVWDHIPPSAKINFKKYDRGEINSLGVPYDFKSILHYVETAWTGGKYISIKARDPSQQKYIKNRENYGLSELDIKQINLLYKCDGNKDPPPPTEPPCVNFSSDATCKSYANRCQEDSAIGRWLRKDCPLTCNSC